MNVLSDILCGTSPLILSSSYNGPLSSHEANLTKPILKQNMMLSNEKDIHLLETLSTIPNLVQASNATGVENGFFDTPESIHASLNLVNSNYPMHHDTDPNNFVSEEFHNSIPSWFPKDLMKVSEPMSANLCEPSNSPPLELLSRNENLTLMELGFPPEITSQNNRNGSMNSGYMPNNQSLISESQVYSSADSLLMSTFTDIGNFPLPVGKMSRSCDPNQVRSYSDPNQVRSYSDPNQVQSFSDPNHVRSYSTNAAQNMINTVLPLDNHLNINQQNSLHLSVPNSMVNADHRLPNSMVNADHRLPNPMVNGDHRLPNPMVNRDHRLPNSVNTTVMANNAHTEHNLQVLRDKRPHISLNHLDFLLDTHSPLHNLQIASNGFTVHSMQDKQPCSSYTQPTVLDPCNDNLGVMSCNNGSLSNLHIQPFNEPQEIVDISSLPQLAINTEGANLVEGMDSAIEEIKCLKCKYCSFLSLDRGQIMNHVKEVHSSKALGHPQANPHSGLYHSNMLPVENYTNANIPVNTVTMEQSAGNLLCNNSISKKFGCDQCVLSFDTMESYTSHTLTVHGPNSVNTVHGPNSVNIVHGPNSVNTVHQQNSVNTVHQQNSVNNVHGQSSINVVQEKANNTNLENALKQLPMQNISMSHENLNGYATALPSAMNEHCTNKPVPLSDDAAVKNGTCESGKKNNKKNCNAEESSTTEPRRISSHKKAWQRKMKRELSSYICEFKGCNVRFHFLDNLEYHRKCHVSGTGKFACPECTTHFKQWGPTAGHLWRNHSIDMELHACDVCPFRTYSLSTLENQHKPLHQDKRSCICEVCKKAFKTLKQLRPHRVIHNTPPNPMKKKFACFICSRQFKIKKFLRTHLVVHNKQKSFLCNVCGYSASKRSTLKMHALQHTGEKPFACKDCDFRTSDHNTFRRHKMKHSGEKPYKCPFCSYACIQSSTYKAHIKRQHPCQEHNLMFSCTICSFRSVKQDNFIAHMADHEMEKVSRLDNNRLPSDSERPRESDILPLVEAMDISLSHGDQSMLLPSNSTHSYLRRFNENSHLYNQ